MNNNELKLREITLTLETLNRKENLTDKEEQLIKELKKERNNLIRDII